MLRDERLPQWQALVRRAAFYFLILVLGLLFPFSVPARDPGLLNTAVVAAPNYQVRAQGGASYQRSAVLLVLSQGDYVRVLSREGGWAQVMTPEEVYGALPVKGLQPAPDQVKPEPLPESLREELEDFFRRLREAVHRGQFSRLAPLLDPAGLFLQGQWFPDAARDPASQKPRGLPLWYASDVSLTWGTAWEVLMTGTNPAPVKLAYEELTRAWRVIPPGTGKEVAATAEKEDALLPGHLQALTLDPAAQLVRGFPEKLVGVPEPETFEEDPRSQPFVWVYQVGQNRYRLEPYKRVGLILVLTQHPGQGLRLRAVATQTP